MSLSRSSDTFFKYKITENHDLSNFKINVLEMGGRKHTVANGFWNTTKKQVVKKIFLDFWSHSNKFTTQKFQGTGMFPELYAGTVRKKKN